MDLTLTDEQQLIKETARELLASRSPLSQARALSESPTGYSDELWKEMVELGWLGLAFPEKHGGIGMGLLELCLVISELGASQAPSPFVPTVLCGLGIDRFGSEEQKSRHLDAIAAGEKVMTFGHVGPSGRWDDPGVEAKTAGEGFELSGTMLFVPWVEAADELLVVARREEDEAGLFVVSADGVKAERQDTIGGDRRYRVELEGARAEPLGGPEAVEAVVQLGTAAACAEMVGGAQRVLDMTVEYASERRQFGKPVGSFQAVQHHCANMAMDVLGARFMTYEAIWRLGEGLDASEEVSLAKAWTSDAYERVCILGHQVHGAIGFTDEYDLHLFFSHATSAGLAFGDGDHHTERVAQHLGI